MSCTAWRVAYLRLFPTQTLTPPNPFSTLLSFRWRRPHGRARVPDGSTERGPGVHPGIDLGARLSADAARDRRAHGDPLHERRQRSPEGAREKRLPRARGPEVARAAAAQAAEPRRSHGG